MTPCTGCLPLHGDRTPSAVPPIQGCVPFLPYHHSLGFNLPCCFFNNQPGHYFPVYRSVLHVLEPPGYKWLVLRPPQGSGLQGRRRDSYRSPSESTDRWGPAGSPVSGCPSWGHWREGWTCEQQLPLLSARFHELSPQQDFQLFYSVLKSLNFLLKYTLESVPTS